MNKQGATLIELIIFILVGSVFLPLAYVIFNSVIINSVKPEAAATVKVLASAKINDIMNLSYDFITSSSSYTNVTTDPRFQRTSQNPYDGYRWKWDVAYIAYQDNDGTHSHSTTIIRRPDNWKSATTYKIGDYVKPSTYPTPPLNSFYRVYFEVRQPDHRYGIGDLVRSTTSNTYVYKSVQPPIWRASFAFNVGDMVRPTSSNPDGPFYRMIALSPWQSWGNAYYSIGDLIAENNRIYRVKICSMFCYQGASPPVNWPIVPGDTVWDNRIQWELLSCTPQAQISGSTEPLSWPALGTSSTVIDGCIKWQEDTTFTTGSSVQFPTTTDYVGNITDGGITWKPISVNSLTSGSSEPSWPSDNVSMWVSGGLYTAGTKIRPTTTRSNNHFYVCAVGGISGTSEPAWSTVEGARITDGSVTWQEKSTVGDNNVSWIRSSPYKTIKVYIAPPNCNDDTCAYYFSSLTTTKNYTTVP